MARLWRCIGFAGDSLPGDVAHELQALREPKALAAMALMFGVVAGAQLTPLGWVADLAAFLLGVVALGTSALQVADDRRLFASKTANAQTDADLRSAGGHLARAISVIGIGTFMLWLTKRAGKLVISTRGLIVAAERVALNTMGREVALWSGIDPLKLPARYATLELMLSETSAGRALLETLKRRNDFKGDQGVWFVLSERAAELASASGKEVHYFVAESRGYRKALATGAVPAKWWNEVGKPDLIKHIRASVTKEGKPAPDIEQRIARLSTWSEEEIEAQYYAEHRRSPHDPRKIEDEVFHKIEKLGLDRVKVHELDGAGNEVGDPFWVDF